MKEKNNGTQYFFKKIFTKNQLFLLLLSSLIISNSTLAEEITTKRNSTYTFPADGILNINSGGSIDVIGQPAIDTNGKKATINIDTKNSEEGIKVDSGYAIKSLGDKNVTINLKSGLISSNKNAILLQGELNAKFAINISTNTSISARESAIDQSSPYVTGGALTLINSGNIIGGATAIVSKNGSLNVDNSGLISGAIKINADSSSLIYSISNSGTINGNIDAILVKSAIYSISNSGTIKGNITSTSVIASNIFSISNSGTINGDIISVGGSTFYSNSGTINGDIISSRGSTFYSISNSGTINGNISTITGKLIIDNTAGSITGNIDLGSNSKSVITLSNGSISGNVLIGHNSQTINLNGGTYSGNIDGSSALLGTVNINSDQTLNSSSSIGSTNGINNLNINSGASLTLNSGSVKARNIALSGSLNLGNTATTIAGNVNGSGSGLLNVGSASHTVNGDLTLNSGDTLKVLIANDGAVAGKATVSGVTTVGSGVKLAVELAGSSNNYKYIASDKRYTLIDGLSGSSINAIADSNININNTGSNKFSVFTLSTSTADNDLFLDVVRNSASVITTNTSAQNIYTAINKIGDSATGSLKNIQQYIDNSQSAAEAESTLKSLTPQVDNGVILGSVTVINNSVATVENRLDAVRNGGQFVISSAPQFRLKSRANNLSSAAYIKTSALRKSSRAGFSFDEDESQEISAWSETFGTTAKQGDLGGSDGYKSRALGFAFGYDKEMFENTRLGLSLNYANSAITGKNSLKKTDIDTYQINTYGSKSFGKYFVDSIVGFSWNEYSSKRKISAVSAQANANYSGQNYVAKIRTGMNQNLGSGFTLSPNASLNYIRNTTGNYTETGADTLSLQVKGSSTNFFEARVGTTLSYETMGAKGTKITPKISASYGYNFLSSAQTTTGNFVGQSVTFNTVSAKLDPRSLKLGTGIDLYNLDSITISADYSMERKQKYQSHSGVLKFKYNF